MNTRSIRSDWNDMVAAYELFTGAPDSDSCQMEWPCVRMMLPDIKGKRVLDLGCGSGLFTFLLEQYAPARLVGIDLSEGMLHLARKKARERNSSAVFIRGDAKRAFLLAGGGYDLIFSSAMAHCLTDLEPLMTTVSQCLKQGGTFILSVIHPVCSAMYPLDNGENIPEEAWQIRYLDRGTRAYIPPWIKQSDGFKNRLSRSSHHTVGDYVNEGIRAGMTLCELQEPLPPERWQSEMPERYERRLAVPGCMILKFTK